MRTSSLHGTYDLLGDDEGGVKGLQGFSNYAVLLCLYVTPLIHFIFPFNVIFSLSPGKTFDIMLQVFAIQRIFFGRIDFAQVLFHTIHLCLLLSSQWPYSSNLSIKHSSQRFCAPPSYNMTIPSHPDWLSGVCSAEERHPPSPLGGHRLQRPLPTPTPRPRSQILGRGLVWRVGHRLEEMMIS